MTRSTRSIATLVVATLLLAGCSVVPYDYTDPRGADILVFGAGGDWVDLETGATVWEDGDPNGEPVPGNYDGLWRWEPAVYVDTTGEWRTGGERGTFRFPAPRDPDDDPSTNAVPVPADYNGDGRTDAAFFIEATATWWIEGLYPFVFGRPTSSAPTISGEPVHDVALPADYDGDGDDDPAVYRVDTGEFHVWQQPTIDTGVTYGFPTVLDHDERPGAEAAVHDPRDRTWVVEGTRFPSGAGDETVLPAPADYDGDGDDDLAHFETFPSLAFVLGDTRRIVPGRGGPTVRPASFLNELILTYWMEECAGIGSLPNPSCPS